jgi:membrane protein YqaA with SNARE-associated domain
VTSLFTLFVTSFLAATVLPLSSEVGFLILLRSDLSPIFIFIAATFGNTLGATANWLIGFLTAKKIQLKKYPGLKKKLETLEELKNGFDALANGVS